MTFLPQWLRRWIRLQCRTPGFNPWIGKIPWRRASNPLQCSCLENLCGQRSLAGYSPWVRRVEHDWATKHTFCFKLNLYFTHTKKCEGLGRLISNHAFKKGKFHNHCEAFCNLETGLTATPGGRMTLSTSQPLWYKGRIRNWKVYSLDKWLIMNEIIF